MIIEDEISDKLFEFVKKEMELLFKSSNDLSNAKEIINQLDIISLCKKYIDSDDLSNVHTYLNIDYILNKIDRIIPKSYYFIHENIKNKKNTNNRKINLLLNSYHLDPIYLGKSEHEVTRELESKFNQNKIYFDSSNSLEAYNINLDEDSINKLKKYTQSLENNAFSYLKDILKYINNFENLNQIYHPIFIRGNFKNPSDEFYIYNKFGNSIINNFSFQGIIFFKSENINDEFRKFDINTSYYTYNNEYILTENTDYNKIIELISKLNLTAILLKKHTYFGYVMNFYN